MTHVQPLRQFTWRLFLLLLAGAVLLAAVAARLVSHFFVADTVQSTRAAVETHFQTLFADRLAALAGHVHGGPGGEAGNGGGTVPDGSGPPPVVALDRAIRLHFGIYDIVHTTFYRPDGVAAYSYDPALAGQPPTGTAREKVQAALGGRAGAEEAPWSPGGGRAVVPAVRLFVPIHLPAGGPVAGAVEVVRDMTGVLAAIRTIQLAITGLVLAIATALFLSLRQVYATSTHALRAQARALEQALGEVRETYDATIRALSSAMDTRDSETEYHSLRVTAYADHLARRMGLGPEEREALQRGALLHDVGKIGVPDAVLLKPGRLTEAEWLLMRRHPQIGAEMLAGIPFLAPALPVVRHHHERWDGQGYPDGLAGEEIPLIARIFAVVDTLDAMTADRPYRAARSLAEGRAEIARCAGTQFDPQIVEAFLAVPEQEWLAIARNLGACRPTRSA